MKVALTGDQAIDHDLPPVMTAKVSSVHHDKFVDKHGENVFELEALPPNVLQEILRDAIDSVIDIDAFNAELEEEKKDAAYLGGVRNTVHQALKEMEVGE